MASPSKSKAILGRGGTPSNLSWGVYPEVPRSIPDLDGGNLSRPDLGWGTPPHQQNGYPPSGPGMGYPPNIWTWDRAPPSTQTWDRVPPPTSVNRLKLLPSLILRMRGVKMHRYGTATDVLFVNYFQSHQAI